MSLAISAWRAYPSGQICSASRNVLNRSGVPLRAVLRYHHWGETQPLDSWHRAMHVKITTILSRTIMRRHLCSRVLRNIPLSLWTDIPYFGSWPFRVQVILDPKAPGCQSGLPSSGTGTHYTQLAFACDEGFPVKHTSPAEAEWHITRFLFDVGVIPVRLSAGLPSNASH